MTMEFQASPLEWRQRLLERGLVCVGACCEERSVGESLLLLRERLSAILRPPAVKAGRVRKGKTAGHVRRRQARQEKGS